MLTFMYFLRLFLMKGLGGGGDKNKVDKFYGKQTPVPSTNRSLPEKITNVFQR